MVPVVVVMIVPVMMIVIVIVMMIVIVRVIGVRTTFRRLVVMRPGLRFWH